MPRHARSLLPALALTLALPAAASGAHARHPAPADFECPGTVRFSPHGGAEGVVMETLRQARSTVHAAIYALTSPSIEAALRERAEAGVRVALKADRRQSADAAQATALSRLRAAGVAVEVSRAARPLHHKFAVVDSRWVITGSFNWTRPAESRNRENVLVLDCPALAERFDAEWAAIRVAQP